MRIIFMGTPDFASTILEKLIEENHHIVSVVTQPDRQSGRGKSLSFSHVKEVGLKHNIPIYQPNRLRDEESIEFIREINPDVIIVAAFGQILPKEILEIPPYGCINVHASLLPKYRGSAPIQYAIINGEEETGITIMQMDEGIDTGDMIRQDKILIDPKEIGGSLFNKLSILGGESLIKALDDIKEGRAKITPQDHSKGTYVKMLNKKMGDIDFTKPAIEIERLIRGLNPWPSAYTRLGGRFLKIWSSEVEEFPLDIKEKGYRPGTVIGTNENMIKVVTSDELLVITELQIEGKKRMGVVEFLRGNPIEEGTILE